MHSLRLPSPWFHSCLLLTVLGCSAAPNDADGSAEADGIGATAGSPTGGAGIAGGGIAGGTNSNSGGGGATSGGSAGRSGGAGAGGTSSGAGGSAGKGSGGSGGSGGTAGAGGSTGAPHVVGACNGLGAVDEFQAITPPQVSLANGSYGIASVLADPIHAGTIYVGTDKQGIYQSTNCGSTWAKVNTGRYAPVIDGGIIWELKMDPIEPKVLYAGSLYSSDSSLLKSTNAGVDWDSLWPASSEVAKTVDYDFLQEPSLDPTDHQHLVVSFHAPCKGQYAPMCMGESKDGGATWRLFKGPTNGWVENSRPLVIGPTTWIYATWADGAFYTSDSGATWERVADGGEQFYRAKDGTYYLANYQGIHRSSDAHHWIKIDGSPQGWAIVGDGKRMFAGYYWCCDDKQPIFTASEATGTGWKKLPSPPMGSGPVSFAYEADHHLFYTANAGGGLWRMVTQ